MGEQQEVILTQEGFDKLEEELNYLKTEKRTEIAERIKVARGFGDLSENSEYDEAKNAQSENEQQIAELEAKIRHAKNRRIGVNRLFLICCICGMLFIP